MSRKILPPATVPLHVYFTQLAATQNAFHQLKEAVQTAQNVGSGKHVLDTYFQYGTHPDGRIIYRKKIQKDEAAFKYYEDLRSELSSKFFMKALKLERKYFHGRKYRKLRHAVLSQLIFEPGLCSTENLETLRHTEAEVRDAAKKLHTQAFDATMTIIKATPLGTHPALTTFMAQGLTAK